MMRFLIDPKGQVTCLYDETIDMTSLGSLEISRASYVEPDPVGRWHVDLWPIGHRTCAVPGSPLKTAWAPTEIRRKQRCDNHLHRRPLGDRRLQAADPLRRNWVCFG